MDSPLLPDRPAPRPLAARVRAALGTLLTLFLLGAALWLLRALVAEYHYEEIVRALGVVRPSAIVLSAVATVAGYVALVGHDYVAFRIVGRPLPLRAMLLPSFVSFAVSNSAPASVLTAGGVRYRMYARLGLTPGEAAGIAGVNVVTYVLGLLALAGLSLLARPATPLGAPAWLALSGRTFGALLLVVVIAYLAAAAAHRRRVRLFGRELRLPSTRLAWAQVGLSAADWVLSSAALYVLVTDVGRLPYVVFLTRFLIAAVVTLVAPTPGGLGVFEAVVLYLTAGGAPKAQVLAALLVYRVVYYLVPLLAAGGVALVWTTRRRPTISG